MYAELKSYESSDMFKLASEENFSNAPLKALNKSLPCNAKSWKKDIDFPANISMTYIVKSARREADTGSDKAERSVKIYY